MSEKNCQVIRSVDSSQEGVHRILCASLDVNREKRRGGKREEGREVLEPESRLMYVSTVCMYEAAAQEGRERNTATREEKLVKRASFRS